MDVLAAVLAALKRHLLTIATFPYASVSRAWVTGVHGMIHALTIFIVAHGVQLYKAMRSVQAVLARECTNAISALPPVIDSNFCAGKNPTASATTAAAGEAVCWEHPLRRIPSGIVSWVTRHHYLQQSVAAMGVPVTILGAAYIATLLYLRVIAWRRKEGKHGPSAQKTRGAGTGGAARTRKSAYNPFQMSSSLMDTHGGLVTAWVSSPSAHAPIRSLITPKRDGSGATPPVSGTGGGVGAQEGGGGGPQHRQPTVIQTQPHQQQQAPPRLSTQTISNQTVLMPQTPTPRASPTPPSNDGWMNLAFVLLILYIGSSAYYNRLSFGSVWRDGGGFVFTLVGSMPRYFADVALLSLAFGVYTFGLQWLIVVGVIRPIRVQIALQVMGQLALLIGAVVAARSHAEWPVTQRMGFLFEATVLTMKMHSYLVVNRSLALDVASGGPGIGSVLHSLERSAALATGTAVDPHTQLHAFNFGAGDTPLGVDTPAATPASKIIPVGDTPVGDTPATTLASKVAQAALPASGINTSDATATLADKDNSTGVATLAPSTPAAATISFNGVNGSNAGPLVNNAFNAAESSGEAIEQLGQRDLHPTLTQHASPAAVEVPVSTAPQLPQQQPQQPQVEVVARSPSQQQQQQNRPSAPVVARQPSVSQLLLKRSSSSRGAGGLKSSSKQIPKPPGPPHPPVQPPAAVAAASLLRGSAGGPAATAPVVAHLTSTSEQQHVVAAGGAQQLLQQQQQPFVGVSSPLASPSSPQQQPRPYEGTALSSPYPSSTNPPPSSSSASSTAGKALEESTPGPSETNSAWGSKSDNMPRHEPSEANSAGVSRDVFYTARRSSGTQQQQQRSTSFAPTTSTSSAPWSPSGAIVSALTHAAARLSRDLRDDADTASVDDILVTERAEEGVLSNGCEPPIAAEEGSPSPVRVYTARPSRAPSAAAAPKLKLDSGGARAPTKETQGTAGHASAAVSAARSSSKQSSPRSPTKPASSSSTSSPGRQSPEGSYRPRSPSKQASVSTSASPSRLPFTAALGSTLAPASHAVTAAVVAVSPKPPSPAFTKQSAAAAAMPHRPATTPKYIYATSLARPKQAAGVKHPGNASRGVGVATSTSGLAQRITTAAAAKRTAAASAAAASAIDAVPVAGPTDTAPHTSRVYANIGTGSSGAALERDSFNLSSIGGGGGGGGALIGATSTRKGARRGSAASVPSPHADTDHQKQQLQQHSRALKNKQRGQGHATSTSSKPSRIVVDGGVLIDDGAAYFPRGRDSGWGGATGTNFNLGSRGDGANGGGSVSPPFPLTPLVSRSASISSLEQQGLPSISIGHSATFSSSDESAVAAAPTDRLVGVHADSHDESASAAATAGSASSGASSSTAGDSSASTAGGDSVTTSEAWGVLDALHTTDAAHMNGHSRLRAQQQHAVPQMNGTGTMHGSTSPKLLNVVAAADTGHVLSNGADGTARAQLPRAAAAVASSCRTSPAMVEAVFAPVSAAVLMQGAAPHTPAASAGPNFNLPTSTSSDSPSASSAAAAKAGLLTDPVTSTSTPPPSAVLQSEGSDIGKPPHAHCDSSAASSSPAPPQTQSGSSSSGASSRVEVSPTLSSGSISGRVPASSNAEAAFRSAAARARGFIQGMVFGGLSSEGQPTLTSCVPYPYNVNLSNFVEYSFMPTLCYEPCYPRTTKIRLGYVLEKLFLLTGLLTCAMYLLTNYILPTVNIIGSLDILDAVSRLIMPVTMLFFLIFFIVFECVLNGLAELTRWGDRTFYSDFWNSTTFLQFSRKWNLPVHEWLLRHVYLDSQRTFGWSADTAITVTFLLSIGVHEIVLWGGLGLTLPYLASASMLQFPLATVMGLPIFKGTRLGNMIFWTGICIGVTLIWVLYARELALAPLADAGL